MGAFLGLDWAAAARQFFRDPVGCVSEPDYIVQEKGKLSADGERGGVWGVNVLSTYILVSPPIVSMTVADPFRSHKNSTPTSRNHHTTSPPPRASSTSPPPVQIRVSCPQTPRPTRNCATRLNPTTRVNTSRSSSRVIWIGSLHSGRGRGRWSGVSGSIRGSCIRACSSPFYRC